MHTLIQKIVHNIVYHPTQVKYQSISYHKIYEKVSDVGVTQLYDIGFRLSSDEQHLCLMMPNFTQLRRWLCEHGDNVTMLQSHVMLCNEWLNIYEQIFEDGRRGVDETCTALLHQSSLHMYTKSINSLLTALRGVSNGQLRVNKSKLYQRLYPCPLTIDVLISVGFVDTGATLSIEDVFTEEVQQTCESVVQRIETRMAEVSVNDASRRADAVSRMESRLKALAANKHADQNRQRKKQLTDAYTFRNRGEIEDATVEAVDNSETNNTTHNNDEVDEHRVRLRRLLDRRERLEAVVGELYRWEWCEMNIKSRCSSVVSSDASSSSSKQVLYAPQRFRDLQGRWWQAGVFVSQSGVVSVYVELVKCRDDSKHLRENPVCITVHATAIHLGTRSAIRGLSSGEHRGELQYDHAPMRAGWQAFSTLDELRSYGAYDAERDQLTVQVNMCVSVSS